LSLLHSLGSGGDFAALNDNIVKILEALADSILVLDLVLAILGLDVNLLELELV
jgi:hypothetical protein